MSWKSWRWTRFLSLLLGSVVYAGYAVVSLLLGAIPGLISPDEPPSRGDGEKEPACLYGYRRISRRRDELRHPGGKGSAWCLLQEPCRVICTIWKRRWRCTGHHWGLGIGVTTRYSFLLVRFLTSNISATGSTKGLPLLCAHMMVKKCGFLLRKEMDRQEIFSRSWKEILDTQSLASKIFIGMATVCRNIYDTEAYNGDYILLGKYND